MARRGVFVPKDKYPYFEEILVDFVWFQGMSAAQKRRSYHSLHKNFEAVYDNECLEISSKSEIPLGNALSAMELKKETLDGLTSVESAFQTSRIYSRRDGSTIGPFPEFLHENGFVCKELVKKKSLGNISYQYLFDGMRFPAPDYHISLFYDYLWLNAIMEPANALVRAELDRSDFTAFTDIVTKALNSQARSCAIYLGLKSAGKLNEVKDYDSYMKLFRVKNEEYGLLNRQFTGDILSFLKGIPESYENVQLLDKDNVKPISPIVKCTFSEREVMMFEMYANKQVICFHNPDEENGFLSNWYPSEFEFSNNKFSSAEQFMMCFKAALFKDDEIFSKIYFENDPKKIKALGRKVKNFDSTVWDRKKEEIMLLGLTQKFLQNEDLKEKLLATGDAVLAECAVHDKIWGIGRSMWDSNRTNPKLWKGKNLLGYTLMHVRENIKNM